MLRARNKRTSESRAYVLFSGKDGASVQVLFVLAVAAVPGR